MGNCIRTVSERVNLIASDNLWIEGTAIQQLETTSKLPGMVRVSGMPDLHPGRGYPIGAAFFSEKIIYPALVGNDIGCGMALWQTDIKTAKLNLDKLERRLGSIDGPLDNSWAEEIHAFSLSTTGHEASLGTIGGGNHFAELQAIDTVHDEALVASLGLDRKNLLLLVHSGSRGYGESVLRRHVEAFGHAGIAPDSPEGLDYLAQHQQGLRYAEANRQLIARRLLANLRAEGNQALDINHNLVSPANIEGTQGWLHRKGATPADEGPVIIPGSRGAYSWLVKPNPSAISLFSLAHGAGRKWLRTDCRDRLSNRFSFDQLKRTTLGSRVICEDKALMYEEAPEAYKDIDSIIDTLHGASLITVIARLKPVLTYKRRGCC
ncbi:RNA ligase RtcB family protein [Pseudomonas asuensis]|uniref:3'-phosphate/5'-hydroxy nucleic acid ligase n=1 Tax=Pseudomonas asuensis TaxID=1825787 RepID=A0ABQ2GY82_9PSED|nr:RNA ligase RtcB family protein [Pseudomonas asuensis]GGM18075.1 RtcB family protein [Pseudomonas asuensis]